MTPACRLALITFYSASISLGAAEPVLRGEAAPTAALSGHLGNPADGLPASRVSMQGFVWTGSGVIYGRVSSFSYSHSDDQGRLCRWQIDPQKQRAFLKDVLNVGGAWCAAPSGALLCAQSPRKDEEQNLQPYERLQMGALGCFKTSDGSRLWKLPLQPQEKVSAAAFTLDEKAVVVLSVRVAQLSLRLLDAASGTEIRRHDFAGPAPDWDFNEGVLHMKQHEVWMRREGKTILRLPLATLTPEVVDCPEAEGQRGWMQVGPDGRRLAFVSGSSCVILERKQDRWETLFEEYSPMTELGVSKDPFAGVIFHPKGLHAVILQSSGARVLQLPSAKVFSSMKGFFEAGVLSPDGRQLLQVNEAGMTILDLATLKPLGNEPRHQHSLPPDRLLFLPDNKTLASADAHGVWLWDLASRRPTARLQASGRYGRREALTRLAYVAGENSLVGDEGSNLIRWRLPAPAATPPAIPLVVASESAFGAKVQEMGVRTEAFAGGPGGSVILVHQSPSSGLIIHQGLGPRAVRTLAAPPMLIGNVAAISKDGTAFRYLYHVMNELVTVDLASGAAQKSREQISVDRSREPGAEKRAGSVVPAVIFPDFHRMVCKAGSNYCLIDPGVDLPKPLWMEKLPEHFDEDLNKMPSASGDEKWLAARFMHKENRSEHLAVWSLTDGRLHALWQLPIGQCLDFALSHDGSLLACAHYNSSISLWEVAKLGIDKAESAPAAPPPEVPGTPGTVITHTLPISVNNRREHPAGSGAWLFSEGGLASQAALLPEVGRLRVNENEFASQGWQLTPSYTLSQYHSGQMNFESVTRPSADKPRARLLQEDSYSKLSAGVISQSEGTAGNIWVTRQIGNPLSSGNTFLTFTDSVVNLGFSPERAVIEFEVRFPEATGRLMDSSFKPIEIAADGEVKLHPDAHWICPILKAGSPNPVPVFVFRSLSSAKMPRLVWHATENRLVVFHDVDLPPAEARHVVHGLRMVARETADNPEIFKAPRWGDFSQSVPFTVSSRGINFSISEEWISEQPGSPDRYRSHKDGLGFEWNRHQDCSYQGSMGAAAVLQLWVDEAPLPYSGTSIFDCIRTNEIVGNLDPLSRMRGSRSIYGGHLSKSLQVMRQPPSLPRGKLDRIMDRVFNGEKEPVTTTLTLLNTFTGPVKKMYAADGKPLPPGAPLAPEMCQGALILEFAGEQRPATMIAFHEAGAALTPRISWPSLQMLRLDYEVTIPSMQSIYLWHAAAQRPLAPFDSVADAFTGCLPFKRENPEKPQLGDSNLK